MALPVNDHYPSISYTTKATLQLLVTTLIFISVSAAEKNDEPRRCHWCGPLAEQVHRSRRAPPCDAAGDQVTACEPGYQYCAVVATAPPYVESRFCVKLYQDECYPLYCNFTKTWKMTCPCRGDLCNGINTEREEEAFGALTKLVAKTHNVRIKKRSVQDSKDNTYGCCSNNNSNQHVNESEQEDSELKTPIEHKIVKTEWTPANDENNVEKKIYSDMNSISDNKIDGMQEEAKMATIEDVMQKTIPIENMETTAVTKAQLVTQAPLIVTPTPMKNTMKTEEKVSMTNVKPTEQMPPAESLQQAAHANTKENMEKQTEITSTETTVTMGTTPMVEETTTVSTMNMSVPHKGFGVKIHCNFCMLLVSVVLFLATRM